MIYKHGVQVYGELASGHNLLPVPGSQDHVVIYLDLETHFDNACITLTRQQHEQDASRLSQRIASGQVEDQLQRALVWIISCLASADPEVQQAGRGALDAVDRLERCKAIVHVLARVNTGLALSALQ